MGVILPLTIVKLYNVSKNFELLEKLFQVTNVIVTEMIKVYIQKNIQILYFDRYKVL